MWLIPIAVSLAWLKFYAIDYWLPFLAPPQTLVTTIPVFGFIKLTILVISYKCNHVVFVFVSFISPSVMPSKSIHVVCIIESLLLYVCALSHVQHVQHNGLWSPRLLCPWNSSGKNTGEGCHFLLHRSSWPRDQIRVSCVACIGRQVLYQLSCWWNPLLLREAE